METSYLVRGVNDVLCYVQSQIKRPVRQDYSSQHHFDLAYGGYNGRANFYIVKKEDEEFVLKGFSPEHLGGLHKDSGVNIPHEQMVIYVDKIDGKKYAKSSGGSVSVIEETKQVATAVSTSITPITNTKAVESNRLFFEIQVDETNGEPLLQFFYDGKVETMEEKILKSFVIKAVKFGIDIESVKNNFYQIKISNK